MGRLRIAKVLSIFCFIIILFSLYIVYQSPGVRGYEISIYDEYPKHFWYLIIFSILICQIVLFVNIFSETNSSLSWIAACIGIVLANSILLLIPLIRRYAIYGSGDPSSHMGYLLDIIDTGYILNNTYPIAHILGVILHWICGFDLNISMLLYPYIFYLFYVLSFYLLYRIVLGSRTSVLIGMMLALLLFGGSSNNNIMFFPQGLSNYFAIFLIYLCFIRSKSIDTKTNKYAILFVIASIFITFFHPLTSIFLIVTFGIYDISRYINKRLNTYSDLNVRSTIYIILIMAIIFFIWQSYAVIMIGTFNQVIAWLNEEATSTSAFETYSQQISEFKPGLLFLLTSFIYKYGIRLSFMLMGTISILVILKAWRDKDLRMNIYALTFSIGFVICCGFYMVSQFLVTGTGYGRVSHYVIIFSLLLIPMAMEYLLKKGKIHTYSLKLLLISLFILTSCITYLTVYTLYMSPIIMSTGQQVTDSQLIGMNTFFGIRSEELQVMEGGISTYRIKDALYGRSKRLNNVKYRTTQSIPNHFNYTSLSYFGDYYSEPVYIVISKLFRILYPNLIPEFPERWRFNQTDFFMLENDKSVSKVYCNRELDIYLLNPISSSKGGFA